MNINQSLQIGPDPEIIDYSTDSLEEELFKFRNDECYRVGGNTKVNNILTRMQISKIVTTFPRKVEDLKSKCSLSANQIKNYGETILKIVEKYIREADFQ